jgi:hypothetical protein
MLEAAIVSNEPAFGRTKAPPLADENRRTHALRAVAIAEKDVKTR